MINLQLFAAANFVPAYTQGANSTTFAGNATSSGSANGSNTAYNSVTGDSYTSAWTGTGMSVEMKTFYDRNLIEYAEAALVHDQFGQKRPIPKNNGKIVEFRKFAPLGKALTPLTEGVTPTGTSLNVSAITATVQQYGNFIVQSDMLDLTAIDNTILEATKLLGSQAGRTLDTVTRDIIAAGTNVIYSEKTVSGALTAVSSRADLDATANLTVKDIQKAVAVLRNMNAPTISGKYVGIIHPFTAYALMRDPEWIDAHKYTTSENLYAGEIGEIAGVRFVSTTEAKIWNDSSASSGATPSNLCVYGTIILGEGAYGTTDITGGGLETIVKQLGYGDDPLNQRSSVGWKATKTAEILVEEYMVRIESCCTDFSNTPAN